MAVASASVFSREDVKVVLIDTQYVETDPQSFKSVVQRLTGKDSCVSWIEEASFTGKGAKRKMKSPSTSCDEVKVGSGEWRLSKGMSFKDLDKMMLEIPTTEELRQLWSQYNLV
ncbi:VQ motif-containing protein 10 [Linum perenne]